MTSSAKICCTRCTTKRGFCTSLLFYEKHRAKNSKLAINCFFSRMDLQSSSTKTFLYIQIDRSKDKNFCFDFISIGTHDKPVQSLIFEIWLANTEVLKYIFLTRNIFLMYIIFHIGNIYFARKAFKLSLLSFQKILKFTISDPKVYWLCLELFEIYSKNTSIFY